MPPTNGCPNVGPPSSEGTEAICRVPSGDFSQAPWYTLPDHLCRFRVRSIRWGYFLEPLRSPLNPIRDDNVQPSSLPAGPGILTWFPSATAFALTLGAGSPCADWPCAGTLGLPARGVLTLFIATHVSIRTSDTSTAHYQTASTAYGTLRYRVIRRSHPKLRCTTLAPIHLRRRTAYLDQ